MIFMISFPLMYVYKYDSEEMDVTLQEMYLKYNCIIIFCCFLTTLAKHYIISTDDKKSPPPPPPQVTMSPPPPGEITGSYKDLVSILLPSPTPR